MKIIIFLLASLLTNYVYEITQLDIDNKNEPIYINNWKENHINDFQVGFYLTVINMYDEINILSLTDFYNFNIDITIKNDKFIYINGINTNFQIEELTFIFLVGSFVNNKIHLTLFINEKEKNFKFINEENFDYFDFNLIKIILGSNKLLLNFQFEGKILCLTSHSNLNFDQFESIKNCNSKILVFHNFRNYGINSNYFYNELENGFSGSINGKN